MENVVFEDSKGSQIDQLKCSRNQKNHSSLKSTESSGKLILKMEFGEKGEAKLGTQVDQLTQSVLRWGSVTQSTPLQTIEKTLLQLNFKKLREVERNGTVWALLGELDTSQVEPLENAISFSAPKGRHHAFSILAGKNLLGFDGASVALRTSGVSIVYARAGSYGYSQRAESEERLSFCSGVNRIWCDIAPIIPSVPNSLVTDEGLRQLLIEDMEKKLNGQDKILMAEIEALAQVEALAVIRCMEEYEELIDQVILDGPHLWARDGFEASLTRAFYLKQLDMPYISVVKNLVASPVMKAAKQENWTDFAFFATALPPGERSCAFLRHDEGRYSIPSSELKRVFFYYKTLQGDLFRYELPLWVWELERERTEFLDCWIADSLIAGGGFSFVCKQADQLVRICKNLRLLLRASYFSRLKERDVELSEPYNQKRWGV